MGNNGNPPVAAGQCDEPENRIAFYPVKAKFVRIIQTEVLDSEDEEKVPWSMKELKLFGLVES